uniref:NADH-ubiquinone oxidoreductase chain 5 n=1 Tax=Prionopetalum kraepelini TaxID=2931675 RepID=A0A8T9JCH0_9MYRI|nr:NADH dehydrogenase subunit 5 [Prionopetalum kraepelini]UOF70474.1 NADH dehydrogenase subunit 5 [Prionopetalum kraepelini]
MFINPISKIMSMILAVLSFFCFISSLMSIIYDKVWLFEWIIFTLNGMDLSFILLFDWMSLMFFSAVLLISSSVIYYSHYYMEGEVYMTRFIMLVLLFVFSMVMVILSPSFISILLGWDGLGLVSYCLVIYYQNYKSFSAGMLTILSNRIGDVGLLIAIGWLMIFGSWNFYSLEEFSMTNFWVIICVLVAGLTKSAQVPFSAWLPAAMAAPTPVSALVHSSTLVTAGVYLLIRFSSLLESFNSLKGILFFLAVMTMFLAGLGANFEMDLKKIVALSTLSQLGLMMSMVALGNEVFAFFHLITHALFKAMLFLCAGSIIHVMGGNQDIRFMGGAGNSLMLSLMFLNIANFSLCGFPFLAGFYSKDLILESVYSSNFNVFMLFVVLLATMLTCAYSIRLSWFLTGSLCKITSLLNLEDNESGYTSPMSILCVGAILGGASISWLIFDSPNVIVLSFMMKLIPIMLLTTGVIVGLSMISMVGETNINNLIGHLFVSSMWFMPFLSGQYIVNKPLMSGDSFVDLNDKGWGEVLGGQGIMSYFSWLSMMVQKWQGNSMKTFLLLFVGWIFVGLIMTY